MESTLKVGSLLRKTYTMSAQEEYGKNMVQVVCDIKRNP
jgi:hypothetical protein